MVLLVSLLFLKVLQLFSALHESCVRLHRQDEENLFQRYIKLFFSKG